MEELLAKASTDYQDLKFEEAINEVAGEIDKYVQVVNDTSTKQYDEFN